MLVEDGLSHLHVHLHEVDDDRERTNDLQLSSVREASAGQLCPT